MSSLLRSMAQEQWVVDWEMARIVESVFVSTFMRAEDTGYSMYDSRLF